MAKLTKRAQILFSKDKYAQLEKIARRRKQSVATLVREAVEEKYIAKEDQKQSVIIQRLKSMNLPTGTPAEMEEDIINGLLGVKKKR